MLGDRDIEIDRASHLASIWLVAAPAKSVQSSGDPFCLEKVRDIVGPYLNPLENVVVLCVNGKSAIQALELTQSMLPMGLGYVQGGPHE